MNAAEMAVLKAAQPLASIVARYADGQCRVGGRAFWLCPFHDEMTPSFTITPDGGAFKCFGCGASGDVIEFVMRVEGLDFKAALEFLRGDAAPTLPAKPKPTLQRDSSDLARRTKAAVDIWDSAFPAAGTLVETYLRGRGITIPIPPSIRFAPNLRHTPTGQFFPTMVAAVQDLDRRIVGIHRTFIRHDGKGKIPFSKPKMMLGPCAKGAVRFAEAGPKIGVGEGIENCLSVSQETDLPVWAALSTSGVKALILPSCVKEVILLPDGNEPGETAARAAAQRFISEGRIVRIARPPGGQDFNDVLVNLRRVALVENYRKTSNG